MNVFLLKNSFFQQADLAEMQQFKRQNRGYRYISFVIDVFSKKAYAKPLKDKTAKNVAEAMENIFIEVGKPIRNLHTDELKFVYI